MLAPRHGRRRGSTRTDRESTRRERLAAKGAHLRSARVCPGVRPLEVRSASSGWPWLESLSQYRYSPECAELRASECRPTTTQACHRGDDDGRGPLSSPMRIEPGIKVGAPPAQAARSEGQREVT